MPPGTVVVMVVVDRGVTIVVIVVDWVGDRISVAVIVDCGVTVVVVSAVCGGSSALALVAIIMIAIIIGIRIMYPLLALAAETSASSLYIDLALP